MKPMVASSLRSAAEMQRIRSQAAQVFGGCRAQGDRVTLRQFGALVRRSQGAQHGVQTRQSSTFREPQSRPGSLREILRPHPGASGLAGKSAPDNRLGCARKCQWILRLDAATSSDQIRYRSSDSVQLPSPLIAESAILPWCPWWSRHPGGQPLSARRLALRSPWHPSISH